MKCIICLKEDVELTKEHIIPEALGNQSFVLKCVCKQCNSLLGDKIDAANCNNLLAQIYRKENKICGKSNSLPNPFKEGTTDDGLRVRLSEDLKPTLVDKVEKDEEGYRIRTSSPQQAIKIINKILGRKGSAPLTKEMEEQILNNEPSKHPLKIDIDFEFDIIKYKLELIKIAYESLYYVFGERILLDKKVQSLREVMYDYIYNDKVDEDILSQFVGNMPETEITSLTEELKKQAPDLKSVHFVSIMPRNNSEIIIMIMVEGMLPGVVKIEQPELLDQYFDWMKCITYPDI